MVGDHSESAHVVSVEDYPVGPRLFFFFMSQTELITPIRDGRIGTDLIHGVNS